MGGDQLPNGSNGSVQISFTAQTLIDRIVERRIDQRDSTWSPSETPGTIRDQIFQEARDDFERRRGRPRSAFRPTSDHNYVLENGRLRFRCTSSPGSSIESPPAASPASTQQNVPGGWPQANFYDSWRSVSPSVELMRMFGSQTINGGNITLTRVQRNSQSSPINLSINKEEPMTSEMTETTEETPKDKGESVMEQQEATEFRRRHSEENIEGTSTSHWKKIMVSNLNQQKEQ